MVSFLAQARIDWASGVTIERHHHLESDIHVTYLTAIVTFSTVSSSVKVVWFPCTGQCSLSFLRRITMLNLIHKWRIAPVLLLDQGQHNVRYWELNPTEKIELTLIGVAKMWFYKSCKCLRFTGDQSQSNMIQIITRTFCNNLLQLTETDT